MLDNSDILVIIFWFSFNAMYLGENNDNLSETKKKNVFFQHISQPFLKMIIFLLDMRQDFLITSNFYLAEILSEPNSLTIVTSKKILKISNYMLILSISFLLTRIRKLQCIQDLVKHHLQSVYYFQKKLLSQIFDGVLNTDLIWSQYFRIFPQSHPFDNGNSFVLLSKSTLIAKKHFTQIC